MATDSSLVQAIPTDRMENENLKSKSKTRTRKFLRFLLLVTVSLLALLFVIRQVWRFSGSNQWELVGEKNGVRVYSLKAPGSDLEQFKGVFRVHSTLAGLVRYFQDQDACKDVGCINAHEIERVDDQLQYASFQYKLPFPFRTREFVVRQQFYQNPHTKEVLAEYVAAPDKTPPDECCFRVTNMNNRWRLTPLENGEVEVEYIMDMNEGGFMPDLLSNVSRPQIFFLLPNLQRWVSKEKYQSAKVDFIKEK